MKLEIIIVSIIAIFLLITIFFKKTPGKYVNVKVGNTEVKAEIANTMFERTKGLMFRKILSEKEGMLFIFDEEGYHSFWMMNMSFPIDIIWVNEGKKVVDIVKDAKPCGLICPSYTPKEKAMYVLEVKSNFTEENKIKIGSALKFELNS